MLVCLYTASRKMAILTQQGYRQEREARKCQPAGYGLGVTQTPAKTSSMERGQLFRGRDWVIFSYQRWRDKGYHILQWIESGNRTQ